MISETPDSVFDLSFSQILLMVVVFNSRNSIIFLLLRLITRQKTLSLQSSIVIRISIRKFQFP